MATAAKTTTQQAPKSFADPLFGATIFLSAFLLFQVQLIIGKAILPWFGGTAAVWTTCMLVFQLLLLGGYAYAHFLSSKVSLRNQAVIHTIVLGLALLALLAGALLWRAPILPSAAWKPRAEGSPVLEIIRLLLVAIAMPFFVLSTTGSLVQRWFAHAAPQASPYRLYALSNTGSLLGLLCYPFVIEPMLSLRAQAWTWSAAFAVFAVLCALTARRTTSTPVADATAAAPSDEPEKDPGKVQYAMWLALPACASAMLLAATNHICQEVAVVPFLWMLPLCIYLLSFILTFDTPKWYRRGFFHPLYFLAFIGAVSGLVRHTYGLIHQIDLALIAMFAVCMVMHGELVRIRPRTRHLTAFYLMVASGGALGGIFVSIIAPHVFSSFLEYPVSLFLCGVLTFIVLLIDRDSWLHTSSSALGLVIIFATAMIPLVCSRFVDGAFFGLLNGTPYYAVLILLGILTAAVFVRNRKEAQTSRASSPTVQIAVIAVLASLGILLGYQVKYSRKEVVEQRRSFFGVLTVLQNDKAIALRHGETMHGWQYTDANLHYLPTSYYVPDSGVGFVMRNYPRDAANPQLRVGLVGLGVGTLAIYGHPGDDFHFYEINQQVIDMSTEPDRRFTFVDHSPAKIKMTLGDGRLSLERESSQQFDVLVLDAFSSDSVPVHLLTREAMQIYRRHLRGPHSILAFHISNRTLDLRPVLVGLAKDSGFYMVRAGIVHPETPTEWILMCEDKEFLLSIPGVHETAMNINLSAEPPLWTDDYSNLLQVLKY